VWQYFYGTHGSDDVFLAFIWIRIVGFFASCHSLGPSVLRERGEVENMNSYGSHTVSPEKFPSAKPLWMRFQATADSQNLGKGCGKYYSAGR
jgi:hypothetical protein